MVVHSIFNPSVSTPRSTYDNCYVQLSTQEYFTKIHLPLSLLGLGNKNTWLGLPNDHDLG